MRIVDSVDATRGRIDALVARAALPAEWKEETTNDPQRLFVLPGVPETVVAFNSDVAYLQRFGARILIGPGSLYTSILPNLMIRGLTEAIRSSRALRVYTCNVMTQPGETDGYSAEDHLAAILDHAVPIVDAMIVNHRRPSDRTLEAYAAQHQYPVPCDPSAVDAFGVHPFFADVISEGNYFRHDSAALTEIELVEGRCTVSRDDRLPVSSR